jgi:SOS-response transcriptional repressor LexA
MKTVAEYIKDKREEKGLSARELAKTAGITGEHIRYIESGQRKTPSFDVVMKILQALRADLQDFLRETGYLAQNVESAVLPATRPVPLVSWVLAGKWAAVCDAFQPGDADEWIETEIKGANVFALKIKGDSMEPEFQDGDIIIVNPHVRAGHNDYVVVRNEEEAATFKQLKIFGKERILHPLNPKYEDIRLSESVQYRIVGKVVEKVKRKRY